MDAFARLPVALVGPIAFLLGSAGCEGDAIWTSRHAAEEPDWQPQAKRDAAPAAASIEFGQRNVRVLAPDGSAAVLRPVARIDGRWHAVSEDALCEREADRLRCPLPGVGYIEVVRAAAGIAVALTPARDLVVGGLGLRGTVPLPGARAWLSNGFHSWSQSGVLALRRLVSEQALERALRARGEEEIYRRGQELSWWYSYAGGGELAFFAGVTTASRLRSWVQIGWPRRGAAISEPVPGERLEVRLVSGGVERIRAAAGERVLGETWQLALTSRLEETLRAYGAAQASRAARRGQRHLPPAGWNSWYELWDEVRDGDLLGSAHAPGNAALMHGILAPRLPASWPLHVVIDDGWERMAGDWSEHPGRFPAGLAALREELARGGLHLGVWIAPLLVDPLSELARRHPDWLLPSAVDWHWFMGQMRILRVLDITHPEAAAYIARSIRRLAAAGVELFKLDYLFLATYEDERHEPMTGIEALHRTLQIVREAAGDEAYLLACGAPPIPSLPHVDGWRVGHDIAFKPAFGIPGPGWGFVANQARQLAARWPLCEAVHCDADPALLRTLPRAEVEAGAWVVAAAGGGLFLSDDLPRLSQERRAWGWDEPQRVALALSGRSAVPLDLIPARPPVELRNMRDNTLWWPGGWFYDGPEQVVPQRWRLQDGSLLGFNASDEGRRIDGVFLPARSARLLP